MSSRNPFRAQIDADDFKHALVYKFEEAGELLQKYVQHEIKQKLRRRHLPPEVFVEQVNEDVQQALEHIYSRLMHIDLLSITHLSSYMDKMIRTATSDRGFKQLLEDIADFLRATRTLASPYQQQLRTLIERCPPPECKTLLDYLDNQPPDLDRFATSPQLARRRYQRVWSMARKELLQVDGFESFLANLAATKNSARNQARTVLIWLQKSRQLYSLNDPIDGDGNQEQTRMVSLFDTNHAGQDDFEQILDGMYARELGLLLIECLSELKLTAIKQHDIVMRIIERLRDEQDLEKYTLQDIQRIIDGEFQPRLYTEIARELGAQSETIRRRLYRARLAVEACLKRKQAI